MRKLSVLVVMLTAMSLPASPPQSTVDKANAFAKVYAEWTTTYEQKVPESYSVTEERAWKQVVEKFDILKAQMKVEHQ